MEAIRAVAVLFLLRATPPRIIPSKSPRNDLQFPVIQRLLEVRSRRSWMWHCRPAGDNLMCVVLLAATVRRENREEKAYDDATGCHRHLRSLHCQCSPDAFVRKGRIIIAVLSTHRVLKHFFKKVSLCTTLF